MGLASPSGWNRLKTRKMERQEQPEAGLHPAWSEDPLVLVEKKRAPEAHGKGKVVN